MPKELDSFARVALAHLPTPLEPMARMSAALGGPPVWVKRDDQTGLAFGGNKTRKLEFLMAAAIEARADIVVTAGAVQSNHVRQTAAAAARLGLNCHLVLFTDRVPDMDPDYNDTGNVFLDRLFGATIEAHSFETADRNRVLSDVEARLQADGRTPYMIPYGGSNVTGTLGCVQAAKEMAAQMKEAGQSFQAVVVASGSAGTQAGFVVGCQRFMPEARVIGIDIEAEPDRLRQDVVALAGDLAATLGHDPGDLSSDVIVEAGYAGPAYGVATPEMREAVLLAARTEGLLLDPVYSGKALAGVIGMARAGAFEPDRPVLFVHTGGTPALFAYRSAFADA